MRKLKFTLFVVVAMLAFLTGLVQAEETNGEKRSALAHSGWSWSACTTQEMPERELPMFNKSQPASYYRINGSGGEAAAGQADVRWQICHETSDRGQGSARAARWLGADARGQAGYQPR